MPPVVGTPLVQKLSLIAMGTPASGNCSPWPAAIFLSTSAAAARAWSRVTVMKAWSVGLSRRDPFQGRLRYRDGGQLAPAYRLGDRSGRERRQVDHAGHSSTMTLTSGSAPARSRGDIWRISSSSD